MINEVIKKVRATKTVENSDFSEVATAIINAKNMNLIENGLEMDCIYYKEDEDNEFFAYKSDEDFGRFEVSFGVFNKKDCDNDRIETFVIEDIRDFRAIIAILAKFDEDPFEFMEKFDEYDI